MVFFKKKIISAKLAQWPQKVARVINLWGLITYIFLNYYVLLPTHITRLRQCVVRNSSLSPVIRILFFAFSSMISCIFVAQNTKYYQAKHSDI
jgi:hypothetical protein